MAEIYGLVDPRDGEIRYIGKADCAAKRLKSHMRDSRRRNTPVYCWIRKLVDLEMMPLIVVIDTVPDHEWMDAERRIIAVARARNLKLLNLADGGNMPLCPPEVRAENARKLAKGRHRYIWLALQRMGQDTHMLERMGNHEAARRSMLKRAHIKSIVERHRKDGTLDALNDKFKELWISRGWAPADAA